MTQEKESHGCEELGCSEVINIYPNMMSPIFSCDKREGKVRRAASHTGYDLNTISVNLLLRLYGWWLRIENGLSPDNTVRFAVPVRFIELSRVNTAL